MKILKEICTLPVLLFMLLVLLPISIIYLAVSGKFDYDNAQLFFTNFLERNKQRDLLHYIFHIVNVSLWLIILFKLNIIKF